VLTWSLIDAIEEDTAIRDGLCPPVGAHASTQKGGSKPKTEFQYKVAEKIFANHTVYREAFKNATTSAEKSAWTTKIKNRLKAQVLTLLFDMPCSNTAPMIGLQNRCMSTSRKWVRPVLEFNQLRRYMRELNSLRLGVCEQAV
jgi:hypothetical protein